MDYLDKTNFLAGLIAQGIEVGISNYYGANYSGVEIGGKGSFTIGTQAGDKSVYVANHDAAGSVILEPGNTLSKSMTISTTAVTSTTPVVLPADPTTALQATTKQYVDNSYTGRNRLINGDLSVNQRAFTSVNLTTTTAYTLDRWRGSTGGGAGTANVTYQLSTPGLLPGSPKQFLRTITSGQSATTDFVALGQAIEGVRNLSGGNATVSFWAKAASGTPKVGIEFYQDFGTGGSPSAIVYITPATVTLSTTWTKYSVTIAIPSLTGKTIGTTTEGLLSFYFWFSSGSNNNARSGSIGNQNNTFDVALIQIEEGLVATKFDYKPYADVLQECQRYFVRLGSEGAYSIIGTGTCSNSTTGVIQIPLPVEMRAYPAIVGTTGTMRLQNGVTSWNLSAAPVINASYLSKRVVVINATVASGLTNSQFVMLDGNNTGAGFDLSADI